MQYYHQPVLLSEVMDLLDPVSGGKYIDCTLGGGGYTIELSKRAGAKGIVVAIDADEKSLETVKEKIKNQNINNIILVHDNFKNLSKIIKNLFKEKKIEFDGIVFDLGLSSAQLEDRSRGFSFQLDKAPLVMEFGGESKQAASLTDEIINDYKESELEWIIKTYGEERFARSIARNIVKSRDVKKIETVGDLLEIIHNSMPAKFRYKSKIHPATRTFQALRIATNNELENLTNVLPQAAGLLKNRGRMAVVSYHSLEDRIVKNYFKHESKECLCPPEMMICRCGHKKQLEIITKKIVRPGDKEIEINPRARSAKLRVAQKVS